MWIVDELRYLHQLFIKNVRRLLHQLSSTARTACTDITKLLRKYYTILFADAPVRVHQKMVDFNRWLAEVLADTRSEGIEWGPSYGESPWLALEEQQSQDQPLKEVFTIDDAITIQLLKTACELYMTRCESLEQTTLTTKLEGIKTQLKEALVRTFKSTLERERELSALHGRRMVMEMQIGEHLSQQNSHDENPTGLHEQILSAFNVLDEANVAPREHTSTDESTSASGLGPDSNDVGVVDARGDGRTPPEDTKDDEATSRNQEQLESLPLVQNEPILSALEDSHVIAEASTPVAVSSSNSEGLDYQQLTQSRGSEEEDGSWYRRALRTLKEQRKQQSLLRKSSGKSAKASSMASTAKTSNSKEAPTLGAHEFLQLVANRDPAENGEDLTWYRRALQHLTEERKRRSDHRNRAESFSSTISSVD